MVVDTLLLPLDLVLPLLGVVGVRSKSQWVDMLGTTMGVDPRIATRVHSEWMDMMDTGLEWGIAMGDTQMRVLWVQEEMEWVPSTIPHSLHPGDKTTTTMVVVVAPLLVQMGGIPSPLQPQRKMSQWW